MFKMKNNLRPLKPTYITKQHKICPIRDDQICVNYCAWWNPASESCSVLFFASVLSGKASGDSSRPEPELSKRD